MKLKVFRLKQGKLEYAGIREIRDGDVILEGETSMAETVLLRESELEGVNAEILAKLSGKEKEDFERGLRNLGMANPAAKAALEASIRRLHPEYTTEQVQTFVRGR